MIFSSQNMHDVEVRFVFGEPVEMPLILAMAGTFILGFGMATFSYIVRTASQGKKRSDNEFPY
ncbi:putative MamL [Magnetofaba australis IT-1]|uniref:Putative MamL n=1 Tax=Magnetofaba australis IT-1 TaxID=1434232 RepID=W0LJB9_9PROT|nr:hypothetical protein MIIT1_02787 [Magnetofaba australis IT-1]OSM08633.1 putative MamL [Magnetofaba australis IT-1]